MKTRQLLEEEEIQFDSHLGKIDNEIYGVTPKHSCLW